MQSLAKNTFQCMRSQFTNVTDGEHCHSITVLAKHCVFIKKFINIHSEREKPINLQLYCNTNYATDIKSHENNISEESMSLPSGHETLHIITLR